MENQKFGLKIDGKEKSENEDKERARLELEKKISAMESSLKAGSDTSGSLVLKEEELRRLKFQLGEMNGEREKRKREKENLLRTADEKIKGLRNQISEIENKIVQGDYKVYDYFNGSFSDKNLEKQLERLENELKQAEIEKKKVVFGDQKAGDFVQTKRLATDIGVDADQSRSDFSGILPTSPVGNYENNSEESSWDETAFAPVFEKSVFVKNGESLVDGGKINPDNGGDDKGDSNLNPGENGNGKNMTNKNKIQDTFDAEDGKLDKEVLRRRKETEARRVAKEREWINMAAENELADKIEEDRRREFGASDVVGSVSGAVAGGEVYDRLSNERMEKEIETRKNKEREREQEREKMNELREISANLEAARKAFIAKDMERDKAKSLLGRFKSFFRSNDDLGRLQEEYDLRRAEYRKAMSRHIESAIKESVGDKEDAFIISKYIEKKEFLNLEMAKADLRMEKMKDESFFEKISRKFDESIDKYRKLPLKNKIFVGAGLLGVGVVSGAVGGLATAGVVMTASRLFSVAVSYKGFKGAFESVADGRRDKKANEDIRRDVEYALNEAGEIDWEKFGFRMETKNFDMDERLQKEKNLADWRTFGALVSAGTLSSVSRYLGGEFAHYAKSHWGHYAEDLLVGLNNFAGGLKEALAPGPESVSAVNLAETAYQQAPDINEVKDAALNAVNKSPTETLENVLKIGKGSSIEGALIEHFKAHPELVEQYNQSQGGRFFNPGQIAHRIFLEYAEAHNLGNNTHAIYHPGTEIKLDGLKIGGTNGHDIDWQAHSQETSVSEKVIPRSDSNLAGSEENTSSVQRSTFPPPDRDGDVIKEVIVGPENENNEVVFGSGEQINTNLSGNEIKTVELSEAENLEVKSGVEAGNVDLEENMETAENFFGQEDLRNVSEKMEFFEKALESGASNKEDAMRSAILAGIFGEKIDPRELLNFRDVSFVEGPGIYPDFDSSNLNFQKSADKVVDLLYDMAMKRDISGTEIVPLEDEKLGDWIERVIETMNKKH